MLVEIIAKNITPGELSEFLKNKKIKLLNQANYKDLIVLHDLVMARKRDEKKKAEEPEEIKEMKNRILKEVDTDKLKRMLNAYKVTKIEDMSKEQIEQAYNKIFKK